MNSTRKILKACVLSMICASSALVVASETASVSNLDAIKNSVKSASSTNLNKFDQAFCIARLTNRHPSLIMGYPSKNSLEVYDYGTVDKVTGKTRQVVVGNSADFENLSLIHEISQTADANLKIEHMYEGWADKVLEMAAEDVLRTFHILTSKPSDKNQFMVQALNRIPMKIVVKNAADLKAFITYLDGVYKDNNFVPTEKSLLVLQIEDMSKDLDDAGYLFLDTYFNVVDPLVDQQIGEFYEKAQEYLDDKVELRHDAYQIGISLGETCMDAVKNMLSKDHKLNIYNVVALMLITKGGSWALSKAWDALVGDKIADLNDKKNKKLAQNVAVGALATFVGGYTAMKIINTYSQKKTISDKELAEVQAVIEKEIAANEVQAPKQEQKIEDQVTQEAQVIA